MLRNVRWTEIGKIQFQHPINVVQKQFKIEIRITSEQGENKIDKIITSNNRKTGVNAGSFSE